MGECRHLHEGALDERQERFLHRAIARFAERYADQNERDYTALIDAIRDGRIEAHDD